MTLNLERLRTLAAEARASLDMLDSFAALSKAEFLADRAAIERVRYHFIVALQACIDICNHVAARRGRRAPSSYADCFKVLGEAGILDGALSREMQRLAGLRNILVHLYWHVDDEQVFNSLKNDLGAIKEFLVTISRLSS